MNFDEISRQFLIVSNPTGNQLEINNALIFTQNFVNKPECMTWVLSTYPTMNNKNVRIQQLIIIEKWCKAQSDKIPQEAFSSLHDLLFTQQYHEAFREDDFRNKLADAQVAFMWKVFPTQWPTFWTDFFNSFNDEFKLQFLIAFTKYASILAGKDNYLYTKIKDQMRNNTSDKLITQFTIHFMQTGNKSAFEIFASLCKWVYTNYLVEAQPLIKLGLSTPNFSDCSLDILSHLVSRGMAEDVKYDLIRSFDIPNQVNQIMQNCTAPTVAISAASLINSAGEVMVKFPEINLYIDLALKFLMHPNSSVSVIVFPFLILLCKSKNEISTTILFKAIERLILYMNGEFDENDYLDQIAVLTRAALNSVEDKNYIELLKVWGSTDNGANLLASNPKLAVAIIYVAGDSLSCGEPKKFIQEFISRFFIILNAKPPIDPIISFGITRFLKFFIAVGENFQPQQISYIFNYVSQLSLLKYQVQQTNDDFHSSITSILNQFLKKLVSKTQFDPQIIYQFIMTKDEQLVAAAGILIRSLDPNIQPQVFGQCMKQLQESLTQIDVNQQMMFIPIILSFIKSLKYEKGAPHVPSVAQFLQSIMATCSTDDRLFSLYLRTAYSSLGDDCFPIICKCVDRVANGVLSLASFCEVVKTLIKSQGVPKDKWVTEIINFLFPIIVTRFTNVRSWDLEMMKSEENKEILELTCSFIQLFSNAIRHATNFIDPKVYVSLKSFVIQAINEHFDIPNLVEAFVDFFMEIIPKDPESVFGELGRLAVNFLYTSNFTPDLKPWARVCKKIINFHICLLKTNLERGQEVISNSFRAFLNNQQQFEQVISRYYSILSLERPRDQVSQGRAFYIDFAKYLAQNH